jgi:hypothetical protein
MTPSKSWRISDGLIITHLFDVFYVGEERPQVRDAGLEQTAFLSPGQDPIASAFFGSGDERIAHLEWVPSKPALAPGEIQNGAHQLHFPINGRYLQFFALVPALFADRGCEPKHPELFDVGMGDCLDKPVAEVLDQKLEPRLDAFVGAHPSNLCLFLVDRREDFSGFVLLCQLRERHPIAVNNLAAVFLNIVHQFFEKLAPSVLFSTLRWITRGFPSSSL